MKRSTPLASVLAPPLRAHRGAIGVAALITIAAGATELFRPWPLKLALDLFLAKPGHAHAKLGPFAFLAHWPEAQALGALALGLVAVAALAGALTYVQTIVLTGVGQRAILEIRGRLFLHLERLSLGFHRRHRSGELLVHLVGDLNVLNDFLTTQVPAIIGRGGLLLGMLAVMLWIDPLLTLASLAFVPLLGWTVRRHVRALREATREQRRREGRIAAVAAESLQLIQVVQAFGAEERESERLDREGRALLGAGLKASRSESLLQRAVDLVSAAGTGLVLYLGVNHVRSGALTAGDLVVFISYLRSVQRPMRDLAQSAQRYAKASACARRVLQLLQQEPEIVDRPGARRAPSLSGAITFDRVGFSYAVDRPALRDVCFRIEPGERVALVGETGAGKSTLLALLGRFYEPTEGVIRLDGTDLRDWTVASVREQIALVLQEAALFGTTIRENLDYGKPGATEEEVWAALDAAQARDFVERLSLGLDTPLGERGSTLSGGQRQRLAIARAMLRDAPLLLLDEPSTGLDAATDRALRSAIARLTRGRTSIVIAHQLETVCHADRILVLDRGHVAGDGRHEDLLATCATYRRLWEARSFAPAPPSVPPAVVPVAGVSIALGEPFLRQAGE
jgi:ATP-binding cassette, subfamily B, bacterial